MDDRLTVEIQRVNDHTRAMLAEYVAWGGKIIGGEVQQWMYNELIDFLNFRMETADTCLQLIERNKIADALGLCRSLLENYLLFILICRGRKFFRLQDCTKLTDGQFKKRLTEEQAIFKAEQEAGTAKRLAVDKYPRAKRYLMHVFEGLKAENDPGLVIPVHYFHFKNFRPEVMRLKHDDYFDYVEYSPDTQKVLQGHQQDAAVLYRHYLSYDALLTCLELNELADGAAITRIEAHYTFLGKFLHPTHDAARDLHEDSNYHQGKPAIGMNTPYTQVARLLAGLYVCYLVAGLLHEIAHLHDTAPKTYVAEAGTEELQRLTSEVASEYPYFWFVFNEPPLYDKYVHCINRTTEEEWQAIGNYANTPNDRVIFNQHIHDQLKQALGSWANSRCGIYTSPIR